MKPYVAMAQRAGHSLAEALATKDHPSRVRREAAPLPRLSRGFGSEGRREGPGRRLSDSRLGRALPRLSADSPRYLSLPLAPRLELHRLGGGSEKFTKFL